MPRATVMGKVVSSSELLSQRTAKANQMRGLVAEYGLVAPQQLSSLRAAIPDWLEDAQNGLSERFRRLLAGLWGNLRELDRRVAELDAEIELMAKSDPLAQRLQKLRGVGPMTATALVATVGNGEPKNGSWTGCSMRPCVAWQGTTTSEPACCESEAGKKKIQWTFSPPNGRTRIVRPGPKSEAGLHSPSVQHRQAANLTRDAPRSSLTQKVKPNGLRFLR